jgi:arsenate reductase
MEFLWYPRCSTCQKIKKILEEKFDLNLRDIKENNPTKCELLLWTNEENIKSFFNTSGNIYKKLNLKDKINKMTYLEKIELLASDGMLVKRPILITNENILVGSKQIKDYLN